MYLFLIIFLFIALLLVIFFHYKKKKILKKLSVMSEQEKCCLLDTICAPLGYRFDCPQGLFSTRQDAWQRDFGYTYAFDRFAPFYNMVFDAQPVYFDYNGRTWLIEFWKGQYGITTGCEIGTYYADDIITINQRKKTHFQVVDDTEMLHMTFSLRNSHSTLAAFKATHWWLTAFCMGKFFQPQNLFMDISITFPNCEMLSAFVSAMLDLGYASNALKIYGHTVVFCFLQSYTNKCNLFCRLNRRFSLWRCKTLCKLYNHMVKPLDTTTDQLLYLYFYLPSSFRHVFLLRIRNHKCRKKQRKIYKTVRKINKKE